MPVRNVSSRSGHEVWAAEWRPRGGAAPLSPLHPSHRADSVDHPAPPTPQDPAGQRRVASPPNRPDVFFLCELSFPRPHCVPTLLTSYLQSCDVCGPHTPPSLSLTPPYWGNSRSLAKRNGRTPRSQRAAKVLHPHKLRIPFRKMQCDLYQGSSLSPKLALSMNTHLVCVGVPGPSRWSPVLPVSASWATQ